MRKANEEVLTIAQIELSEAIDNIDAIASTEGIDALLIGPADLSNSLGVSGQFNHPKMDEAITKVALAAKKYHKIFGFHAAEELTRKWMPHGLTLRMSLMDIGLLAKGMAAITSLRD